MFTNWQEINFCVQYFTINFTMELHAQDDNGGVREFKGRRSACAAAQGKKRKDLWEKST